MRRGLALRFRSGRGPLTFRVAAMPLISATPSQEIVEAAAVAAPVAEGRSPRPPLRRQSAAERYQTVLPRSLRQGQQGGQRNGVAKRRPR
jgi:hypothetical protein